MAENLHDSRRKNELIMGPHIPINIDEGENEVKRKVYRESIKEGQQRSSMRLCDRVIVRQWMENKCHHYVKEPQTFCKARVRGVLMVTPRRRCLKKVR